MSSAGTVTVDFAAETARFTSELRKVNAAISQVGDAFDSAAKIAKTAFAAISFAAVTNQIENLISKSLELGGAIADATKKAGISAEAFSELNFAAKLSGVGIDDLSSAFTKFQKELAGGGDKIRSLGIDLDRFRGLQPDRQFEALAQAISQIDDPATRAAAAVEVFGKSGANLLPLFEQGAKGIRAARDEAQRLGITLSTEQANALDNAGDAVDKLKSAYDAFAEKLTAKVAPALTVIIEKLAQLTAGTQSSEAEVISARIAELDAEIAKRSRDRQVGRGGRIAAEDPNASAERIGRGGIPANLSAFLQDRAALLERLGQIERKQKQIEDAAVAATSSVVDPGKRTFGTVGSVSSPFGEKEDGQLQADMAQASEELFEIQRQSSERFLELKAQETQMLIAEQNKRDEADAFFAESRIEREQIAQQAVVSAQAGATDAAIGLLQTFAAKSKAAAIALVVINKAKAIAMAIQNTLVGATLQLTSGDPYSAIPRAAAVKTFGAIQVGLIAASGIGEIAAISGGSNAPVTMGTPNNPVFTQPQQQGNSQASQGASLAQLQPTVTQVVFNGPVMAAEEAIVEIIRKATDNDVIVINARSAQAQMFMPAQ